MKIISKSELLAKKKFAAIMNSKESLPNIPTQGIKLSQLKRHIGVSIRH